IGRWANTGSRVETIPAAGRKMMYTSGRPNSQNRCCHSNGSPPPATSKNTKPAARSSSSSTLARIRGGKPTMIISAMTRMYQQKIGMRRRLMPLLRVRRMDTSSSMAPLTEDISTKVMPSSQKSEPGRSEEHTSELQSRPHLVCRLLLEKKKKKKNYLLSITVMSYQNK